MVKGFHKFILFLCILMVSSSAFAQTADPNKEYNPLYRAIDVVKKASYDNFKSIKLLHTAIINFGGGEAEFDRLVNEYAEASALYFRGQMEESANLFTKNSKEIQQVALKIAQKYKTDTETLHKEIIKFHVKNNIKLSLKGEKTNPTAELLMNNGASGILKANDFMERSKPIDAIYYYRRAKENCFKYYEVTGQKLPDQFKKDIVDNQNKIYTSKEKEK